MVALAGGGGVQPINFKHAQQVTGKTFSPEVAVKDPATNYTTGLAGKEFRIETTGGLKGAKCETTQKISDNNGTVKADCSAEEYGSLEFKIIDVAANQSLGAFSVYLTENGSGFPQEGTKGAYTIFIIRKNFSTPLNTTYYLEAQLHKNGEITTNYEDVEFFSWQLLDGSVVMTGAKAEKNRIMWFEQVHPQLAVIRVVAVMKDGSTAESGVITVTTGPSTDTYSSNDEKPVPTPAMTPQPVKNSVGGETESEETVSEPTPVPVIISASESAEANQQLMDEIDALKQKVAEQEVELNVLQKIVESLRSMVAGWFGRGE